MSPEDKIFNNMEKQDQLRVEKIMKQNNLNKIDAIVMFYQNENLRIQIEHENKRVLESSSLSNPRKGSLKMKMTNSAKSISIFILSLIMTGCASNWQKYQERTDYNLMQCAKMCSTGNVAMIKKFDCACRFNNPGNSSNQNKNISSSQGNVIYMNTGGLNSSQNQFWGAIAGQLMQHEENRLNRLNRDLNSPNPNVVPQNNTNIYNNMSYPSRTPSQFGGFGGF